MRKWILAAVVALPAWVAWGAEPSTTQPASQPTIVSFMGIEEKAQSVIFICPGEGSMMMKFDPLRIALRRSITALHPSQRFTVIVMRELLYDRSDVFSPQLVKASEDNKAKALHFLDEEVPPPIRNGYCALDLAIKLKPDVVFLVDEAGDDGKAIIKACKERNARQRVRIDTIGFLDPSEEYQRAQAQIASDNGGRYRYVSEEDLDHMTDVVPASRPAGE